MFALWKYTVTSPFAKLHTSNIYKAKCPSIKVEKTFSLIYAFCCIANGIDIFVIYLYFYANKTVEVTIYYDIIIMKYYFPY